MSYDNPKAALATASEPASTVATGQLVSMRQCLVVSAHAERRDVLRRAAIEGGWLPLVFADAELAWEESRRSATPLVVVDVHDDVDRPANGNRWLFERLSREPGHLMAACGREALAPQDEIWARQLGAWLVLPGVADAHDLSIVFEEAGKVLERNSVSTPAVPHARRGPARNASRRRGRS
ncbi:MAG: hypothetical protein DCC68_13475 [Planctomycetota bacterium]|nr:MAG: hypothetical protein DCC68_13475 [Planctomycetota bacterium]